MTLAVAWHLEPTLKTLEPTLKTLDAAQHLEYSIANP
jgi:hypothetical protein